jgi:hypothetical protein
MTTETAHAAYWLYNRSEPHPFERITLLWRGWTTRNGHRRRMSRRRDSSEAALLDDLARIFRETNAETVYIEGTTSVHSHRPRPLGSCHRYIRQGEITFDGPVAYRGMFIPD